MNAVVLGFLILTVLSVFLLYYSKDKKTHRQRKHIEKKESFVGSEYASAIMFNERPRTDFEIAKKEDDIRKIENDLALLLNNLDDLEKKILSKQEELSQLRKDKKELDDAFDILLRKMEDIRGIIASYVNNDDKPFVGTLNVFDLQAVLSKKEEIGEIIDFVKQNVEEQLSYYTDADISTADKIQHPVYGVITELNNVKQIYDRVFEILKKSTSFMEVCSGEIVDNPKYPEYVRNYIKNDFDKTSICSGDNVQLNNLDRKFRTTTDTNFELGKTICESKTDTCIYETSTYFPKSYERGSYSYIFHKDKWPLENSCEAINTNCFSFDTLGDDACKGIDIPMWFIKSDEPGEYYTSNVGYVPFQLNENEWMCKINLDEDKQIHNKETAGEIASANCLQENRGYGMRSYDCWTVTDGDINISHNPNGNKQSKRWTDDINNDGSYGRCEIDTTCRNELDTRAHVNCLKEEYSGTGNFQCWRVDSSGGDSLTAQATSNYRNIYELGKWNSNDNVRERGICKTKVTDDCRTMHDVKAEIDCLTKDNWMCSMFNFQPHASNIGLVEVIPNGNQMNKTYSQLQYTQLNNDNKGVGECKTTTGCLNPTTLQQQADCHNSDENYRCWKVNDDHSASLTENETYMTFNNIDGNCVTNNLCLSMESALSIAEENCHASESARCYEIDNDSKQEDGSVGFKLSDDIGNGYTEGRLTKFVKESDTRYKCVKRECPSTKESLCQSLSVSCYLDNLGNHIKTNADGEHNMESVNMIYDETLDKCVIPESCKQVPYCSYKEVYTGSSVSFDINDVGGLDCSAGNAYGVKHKWMLESSTQDSIHNPNGHLDDLSKWSFIGGDISENLLCVRDPNIPSTSISPPVSEETEDYTCECTENNYSSEMRYFIKNDFSDNDGSGFETVEGICSSNDCGERSYHQANVRLIPCFGDKYKNVTSNVGTYNCVDHDACRRKCLNTGKIDGEPVIVPPDQGIHIQCYAPITNEVIDKFSYDDVSGTCSSNDCSDTHHNTCSYQIIGDDQGWTREIVSGTTNNEGTFAHNPDSEEIFGSLATGLSQEENTNTINYDTRTNGQVGCPDPSDHTVPDTNYTKKSVYKYTRTVTQNDDGVCVPVPDKTQVKYTIEEDNTPCPMNCVYYWETDGSGNPVYGDCSSTCRETITTSVTKTQNYSTRAGNSAGNSICATPTETELDSHTINCEDIPLCCTPKYGTWGDYMYGTTNYGSNGDCPSCTSDGNSFTLTRSTTGRITCDSTTGVADKTEGEETKTCNPNKCGDEVPDSSSGFECLAAANSVCTLSSTGKLTKSGTETRNYQVYTVNGPENRSQSRPCSLDCNMPQAPTVTVTNVSHDEVTIHIKQNYNGDTTFEKYQVYTKVIAPFSTQYIERNIIDSGSSNYKVTGLNANTPYEIKVTKITSPYIPSLEGTVETRTNQAPAQAPAPAPAPPQRKPLSQVTGPIRLISVRVNALPTPNTDDNVRAAALITRNGSNTLFNNDQISCINDQHSFSGYFTSEQYLKDFGKEMFDTGVTTGSQQTDTITSAISTRLNALPYANSDIFGLEYDSAQNDYYLYYRMNASMPKFYLTGIAMSDQVCFKKTKTNEARLQIDEMAWLPTIRGEFNNTQVWKKLKGYKIKFKHNNLYLDAFNANNHAFSMRQYPFSPYFIIVSLDDGQMYPSKF